MFGYLFVDRNDYSHDTMREDLVRSVVLVGYGPLFFLHHNS